MAISLENAIAAVKAVNSFDAISNNMSAHADYHFFENKARARVALGGQAQVCGFYTRKSTAKTYTHNVTNETLDRPKKKWRRMQYTVGSRVDKTALDGSSPIAIGNSRSEVINKVLIPALNGYADGAYKEDGDDPDNVFHYIYPLPDGYGGTTARRAGGDLDCSNVDIVIRRNGLNCSIITHYPCTDDWRDGKDDLT